MSVIFNPKSPLLIFTLASTLLMVVGCNKPATEPANEGTKDAAAVQAPTDADALNQATNEAATANANTYATAEVVGVPMAKAAVYTIVQAMGNEISESERKCLLESANSEGKVQLALYLTKHLTPEELKVSDDFFASPIGVKLYEKSLQQLAQLKGEPISEPITFTPEEQAKLEEFQAKPVAIKIKTLLNKDNTAKLGKELFKPMLVKEFSRCNIELEVPDL